MDLGIRHPRSLHTHWLRSTHRQEEPIALANELLGTRLVQNDSRIGHRGGREGQPRRNIGLDKTGAHIGRWTLSSQHQVDTGSTCQLGNTNDGIFNITRGYQHEIGQLVNDDQQVRVGSQDPFRSRRQGDLASLYSFIEVLDVTESERSQVVIALVHLTHDPLQSFGGLLGAGNNGRH